MSKIKFPSDSAYLKLNSENKVELHLDGRDAWQKLPEEVKTDVKRAFLWSNSRKCWVSRSKDGYMGYNMDKYDIPYQGKEEIILKSVEEQEEDRKDKLLTKAAKFEKWSASAEKKAEQLKSDFNHFRKDWAWLTQPFVNTSGGRSFRNHKQKVMDRYDKGMAMGIHADNLKDKAQELLSSAEYSKLKNYGYLQNKVKELEKYVKNNVEYYEKVSQIDLSKLKENSLLKIDAFVNKFTKKAYLLGIYQHHLAQLSANQKEQGIVNKDETAELIRKHFKKFMLEKFQTKIIRLTSQRFVNDYLFNFTADKDLDPYWSANYADKRIGQMYAKDMYKRMLKHGYNFSPAPSVPISETVPSAPKVLSSKKTLKPVPQNAWVPNGMNLLKNGKLVHPKRVPKTLARNKRIKEKENRLIEKLVNLQFPLDFLNGYFEVETPIENQKSIVSKHFKRFFETVFQKKIEHFASDPKNPNYFLISTPASLPIEIAPNSKNRKSDRIHANDLYETMKKFYFIYRKAYAQIEMKTSRAKIGELAFYKLNEIPIFDFKIADVNDLMNIVNWVEKYFISFVFYFYKVYIYSIDRQEIRYMPATVTKDAQYQPGFSIEAAGFLPFAITDSYEPRTTAAISAVRAWKLMKEELTKLYPENSAQKKLDKLLQEEEKERKENLNQRNNKNSEGKHKAPSVLNVPSDNSSNHSTPQPSQSGTQNMVLVNPQLASRKSPVKPKTGKKPAAKTISQRVKTINAKPQMTNEQLVEHVKNHFPSFLLKMHNIKIDLKYDSKNNHFGIFTNQKLPYFLQTNISYTPRFLYDVIIANTGSANNLFTEPTKKYYAKRKKHR